MRTPSLPSLIGERLIHGAPRWLFSDGTTLPIIRGGADDGGQGSDGGDDASNGGGRPGNGGAADGGAGQGSDGNGTASPPPGPITFTPEQQAHIDKLIGQAHGKAKGQAEADFKKWLDQQAMSESDRVKAERDQIAAERDAARLEALTTRVETTAERLALAAGVKADRLTTFMRLVDLDVDALAADGKIDTDAVKALVDQVAAANPEFKGTAAPAGASGGEMGGNGTGKVWTRDEVAKLSVDEFEKHAEEIRAQMRAGTLK